MGLFQPKAPTIGSIYNNPANVQQRANYDYAHQDEALKALGLSPLEAPRSTGPTLNPANWFAGEQPQGAVGGGGGSGGGGGYSAPAGPTAAQLAVPNAALAQLDTILGNKNEQSQQEHDTAVNGYNAQDAIDQAQHADSVAKNETTYTGNNQAGLLNAANASSGLRGVLSSLGALGGSGADVVRRLVGLAANSDTGSARNAFDTNATTLTHAGESMDQAEKQRKLKADELLGNNKQNNRASVLTSRQNILEQLAGLFGAGSAKGNDYATQAAALSAPIAATTRATVAPYASASALYTPAALKSYLGGTQNLNVATSGGGDAPAAPINAPGYGSTKKDRLTGVA